VRRYHARAPQLEPVSVLGAGDVFLARWLAAQGEGVAAEEALRLSVAAASASVLVVGAGRFDPKEAARLTSLVEVNELQPVA
jgi:fructose-1-phosphate kinase PfkB-like protein